MKIVFLDVDGVLNSNFWNDSHQKEISAGVLIDEEKVRLLAEIIARTNARIILHSGWRFWLDEQFMPLRKEATHFTMLMKKYKLEFFDRTPDLRTEEVLRTNKLSLVKASEILSWLSAHEDIERYLVLEDLDLHNDVVRAHQVQTDQTRGLTREDVEQAVHFLSREDTYD